MSSLEIVSSFEARLVKRGERGSEGSVSKRRVRRGEGWSERVIKPGSERATELARGWGESKREGGGESKGEGGAKVEHLFHRA